MICTRRRGRFRAQLVSRSSARGARRPRLRTPGSASRHSRRAAHRRRARSGRPAPEARRAAGTSWRWRWRAAPERPVIRPSTSEAWEATERALAGRAQSSRGAEAAGVDPARAARVPARASKRPSDQQAGAGRRAGLRVPGGRLYRARSLRGRGEGRAVDAGHAARQRSGVDPRRASARAVRRSRGRRRADGHVLSADRRRRSRGPRLDPHADRAPVAAHLPHRGGRALSHRGARRSSPTITTRWRRWPRCVHSRAALPTPSRCASGTSTSRRTRRIASSSASRSRAPAATREAEGGVGSLRAAARGRVRSWDSANIELIYYYADHAGRAADALALARREAARRQDVRTLEALAWALHGRASRRRARGNRQGAGGRRDAAGDVRTCGGDRRRRGRRPSRQAVGRARHHDVRGLSGCG